MGSTRADGQVTLEAVYCLGLCATGPNALVNGVPISRIDEAKLDRIAASVARSEEHTSELQSLMRNSYSVFCLKKKIISKKNALIATTIDYAYSYKQMYAT